MRNKALVSALISCSAAEAIFHLTALSNPANNLQRDPLILEYCFNPAQNDLAKKL